MEVLGVGESDAVTLHLAGPASRGGVPNKVGELGNTTVQGWLLPVHGIPGEEEATTVVDPSACACPASARSETAVVHVTVPLTLASPVLSLKVPRLSIVRPVISANAGLPIARRTDVAMRVNLFTFILLDSSDSFYNQLV